MQRDDEQQRPGVPKSGSDSADSGYGFSGRTGFSEGNYSGAYGRGSAGERDNPSASGVSGAGTSRGGAEIPAPDEIGGEPLRVDGASDRDDRDDRDDDPLLESGLNDTVGDEPEDMDAGRRRRGGDAGRE